MMGSCLHRLKYTLAGVLLSATAAAWAGSIEVTPVRINLSAATRTAALTVRNTGTTESVLQVTLNSWLLNGPEYAYAQSQELVITPVTFRLAAGAEQTVRVGMRSSAPTDKEISYRLLVEEVPPPPVPGLTGAVLVVRHDLPVFVAPVAAPRTSLHMDLHCSAEGSQLHVANTGNLHSQLRNVALIDSVTMNELASWDAFDYLLPDAEKLWDLRQQAPAVIGKPFSVTLLTDQGTFTADVSQPCP